MKQKNIFEEKKEQNIFITQVISILLLGLIIIENVFNKNYIFLIKYHYTAYIFVFFIVLIFLIKFFNYIKSYNLHKYINLLLLVTAFFFLLRTNLYFLKIFLILPPVISALKYGFKKALIDLFLTISIILFISYKKQFITIDADIMLICVYSLLTWLLGSMTETEAQIRKELERMATHDGLTDIYNNRSFHSILDQELEKALKEKTTLSLMLIDIDYFKVYNDSMGHLKGDVVLKKIAQILNNTVGHAGFCARYGGEEFGVILPKMKIEVAKKLAEEIRSKIEQQQFPGIEVLPQGKMTVSIGIAEYPNIADGKEKLIQKADEALYKAKFVSKNKVETYYSVFDELGQNLQEEEKELFNTVRTLTMVINAKDRYTYGHSERTMNYARRLAEKICLDEQTVKNIIYGALLHDIGKIEIPREILNKPGKLNDEEWQMLKQHPLWGADIIRPLQSFKGSVDIIMYHHENFDGTGYYQILKGEHIPIGARILRIVDSFDAITTKRPYKEPMTFEQALEEMERFSGTHYDPLLFAEFKEMISSQSNS